MNRKSTPLGQPLASLTDDQRAERYRQLASEAVRMAQDTTNAERRAEYLTMASSWHAMASEADRRDEMKACGEAIQPDPGEVIQTKPDSAAEKA